MSPPTAVPAGMPRVHVWLSPVREALDVHVLDAVRSRLDPWEQERLARFRHSRDQVRFAAAHALVRVALSSVHPAHPAKWRLSGTPEGKPVVVAPATRRPIHFSLSHTAGLVGCAVTAEMPVGFDVEAVNRTLEVDRLARHTMSPAELARRPAGEGPALDRWFLRHWTLKEALAKAVGLGVSVGFAGVEVDPGDGRAEILSLPPVFGDVRHWQARTLDQLDEHVGAVAVQNTAGTAVELRCRRVGLDEVVAAFA